MTEQHQLPLSVLESERRFRLLVESVRDYAIFMLDPEGRVSNWNSGAERIKGYAAAEIIGEHFSRFYVEEDVAAGRPAAVLEAARRDGRYEAEGWRRRKDGSRFWANVVVDTIYDHGKIVGFAKVTRDLTERREAQLQLEQSREQLFQAQKMEAVGQLTGGLAHDFNNLLTGIIGGLSLIRTRISQGRVNELERYLSAAEQSASLAAALTHRLLAFARRQTLDPKVTAVNRLVASIRELIQRTVGPQIAVETVLAPALWPVLCDPNQLENAILNLSINARDAMPRGGRLTIETAAIPAEGRRLLDRDLPAVDYVALRVIDTGTGMTPEVAARAFDPFFTTKPLGQGTGLGLSMIHGFVRQSGGEARIHSEIGAGTTVSIYLPRYAGDEAADDVDLATAELSHSAAHGETVLVVDDEPSVRMMIRDVLDDMGFGSIEAADGGAALKILQSNLRIDLLITDVGLPGGMNGRQIADAARETRPDLKVLFITGYDETAAASNGLLAPGMHVLAKPFTMDTLANRVRLISQRI